jgi:hypothetical protein
LSARTLSPKLTLVADVNPQVPLRIVAAVPLLRLGLERIATDAGFRVVGDESAALVLHGVDEPATDANVDIAVGPAQVALQLRRVPDERTWTALQTLLNHLLGRANGSAVIDRWPPRQPAFGLDGDSARANGPVTPGS